MGGKAKGVGKRGVGSSKSRKTHKQGLRAQFESRHLDLVWEDIHKAVAVHDGKTAPVGNTSRLASAARHHNNLLAVKVLLYDRTALVAGLASTTTCLPTASTTAFPAGVVTPAQCLICA